MVFTEEIKNDLKSYLAAEEISKNRIYQFDHICVHVMAFNYIVKCKLEFILRRLSTFCAEHRGVDYSIEFDVKDKTISLVLKDFLTGEAAAQLDFHRGNWARENEGEMIPKHKLWLLWLPKNGSNFPLLVTPLKKMDDKK